MNKNNNSEVSKRPHSITIENRNKCIMSGIVKVISSSDAQILLDTTCGRLNLVGNNFKINRFDVGSGELSVDGELTRLIYAAAKVPFVKKVFK